MDEELQEEQSNNSLIDRVREFTSTPQGRIAAIAGASAVLFIILFFVFLAVFSAGNEPSPESKIVNPVSAGTDSTPSVSPTDNKVGDTSEGVAEESFDSSFEVYQTRDPFKPMDGSISAASVTSDGQSGSSTGGSSTIIPPETTTETVQAQKTALSLNGVTKQDGINYADIDYGGTAYSLKAGDRVGSSSYQVQQVGETSVTLLYGDDQFTLQVGQEVFK